MSKSTKVPKRDPIFAAVNRCLRAQAACDRIPDGQEVRIIAAEELVRRARCALTKVAPTTLEGLAALARFLDEQSSAILKDAFFDNDREHLAFYASLRRSLEKVAAQSGGAKPDRQLYRAR